MNTPTVAINHIVIYQIFVHIQLRTSSKEEANIQSIKLSRNLRTLITNYKSNKNTDFLALFSYLLASNSYLSVQGKATR